MLGAPGMTREHPRNSETTKPGCLSLPQSTNSKGTRLRPWRTAALTSMSEEAKRDTRSAKGIRRSCSITRPGYALLSASTSCVWGVRAYLGTGERGAGRGCDHVCGEEQRREEGGKREGGKKQAASMRHARKRLEQEIRARD